MMCSIFRNEYLSLRNRLSGFRKRSEFNTDVHDQWAVYLQVMCFYSKNRQKQRTSTTQHQTWSFCVGSSFYRLNQSQLSFWHHLLTITPQNNERINEMNQIRKEKHIIELNLEKKFGIPVEINQTSDLHWHPHSQIQTWNGPKLKNHLLVSFPFEGVSLHRSFLNPDTNVNQQTSEWNDDQWKIIHHEQIEIVPMSIAEVTRKFTEHLRIIILWSTRIDENRTSINQRWEQKTKS